MHWWINIGADQGRQCVFLSFGRFPPSGCLAVVWSAASQRPPPHTSQLSSRLSLGVWRWWATLQNAVSLFSQRVTFTSWLESGNGVFGVKITTRCSCRCAEVSLKTSASWPQTLEDTEWCHLYKCWNSLLHLWQGSLLPFTKFSQKCKYRERAYDLWYVDFVSDIFVKTHLHFWLMHFAAIITSMLVSFLSYLSFLIQNTLIADRDLE